MSARFVPNNFQYNGQIAAALGPCLVVAAAIGGQPVMAALAIGSMIRCAAPTPAGPEGLWVAVGC